MPSWNLSPVVPLWEELTDKKSLLRCTQLQRQYYNYWVSEVTVGYYCSLGSVGSRFFYWVIEYVDSHQKMFYVSFWQSGFHLNSKRHDTRNNTTFFYIWTKNVLTNSCGILQQLDWILQGLSLADPTVFAAGCVFEKKKKVALIISMNSI